MKSYKDFDYWLKSLEPTNKNSITFFCAYEYNIKTLDYQCNLQSNIPSLSLGITIQLTWENARPEFSTENSSNYDLELRPS